MTTSTAAIAAGMIVGVVIVSRAMPAITTRAAKAEHCDLVSNDDFSRLTEAQKKAIAYES